MIVPLSATPAQRREAVCDFYRTVGSEGLGPAWAGETLAIHFGLDGEGPSSLEEALIEANRYLAERAGVGAGTRVLDAGCGVGGSSLWLARERGARVTGVTLVPEQVEAARRHAEERGAGCGEVAFHVLDFMNTGLPEASFDVIWNLESLCHAHDVRAYLDHAHALLAGGGRFACLDIFLGAGDAGELRAMREACAFGDLAPPGDVAAQLEQAGFADVEVIDLRARVLRSVEAIRQSTERALLRLRFARALLGTGAEAQERHAQGCLACAGAVLSGALTYAYVGARRPPR
jgi:cyclopropane fatty-acyl-phospholipid synthase-like methyltransferase